MANIYAMSDTWNDGATTFTSIKMDVTDTASASGSLLMDLQVGGVSQFSVDKSGQTFFGEDDVFLHRPTANALCVTASTFTAQFRAGIISARSTGAFAFLGSEAAAGTPDTYLYRDGVAGTIAQRNGTNAQTFNIYNTYTDASNYERGYIKWNSNVLEIGPEAAGTGTARTMVLQRVSQIRASADPDQYIQMGGAGYFSFYDNAGTETVRYGAYLDARSVWGIRWSSTSAPGAGKDTGIIRSAAGVVKITDGSSGTGELIFIVPTSDPGITGALWNNGGTLAISA